MNNMYIAPTASSPEIDLRFDSRHLLIKGEAYPENAALFWGEVINSIRLFAEQDTLNETLTVDIALTYFNSSSTKMLFSLLDTLNGKAASGTPVVLNWYHDEEDDTIYEFGQELCEDFPDLTFHDHALQG
ncbi:MAG TPA: Fe-S oxidoreductase [Pusillimonas sp.]|nr:Fe-S oxidoreductase [Pusillimonas sp.]